MKHKRLIIFSSIVVALLLIPFIAMQFNNGVDWDIWDFTVMGILLLLTGFFCEIVMQNVKSVKKKILICGATLLLFLLIWVELAVGIFGTPFEGS